MPLFNFNVVSDASVLDERYKWGGKNALPFCSVTYFWITIRLTGCMFFNKFTTIAFILHDFLEFDTLLA